VDDRSGNSNGVAEPGETVSIFVEVENPSQTEPINALSCKYSVFDSQGVFVADESALWRPLAPGEISQSIDPIELSLSEDVVCGSTIGGSLMFRSETRLEVEEGTLVVGRFTGTPEEYFAKDLPLPILDGQTTISKIEVTGDDWQSGTKVIHAHLSFDIEHSYVGDLVIKLIAPDGRKLEVYRGSGSSSSVHYSEDLSKKTIGFLGGGIWILSVYDSADMDIGTLQSFSLKITPAKYECN